MPTPLGSPSLSKSVSFDTPSSSTSSLTPAVPPAMTPTATPTATAKRRSSLKQGAARPYIPAKHTYQHPDPLIRRLRLRDTHGKQVNLKQEFRDAKVVLFYFGSTWQGSSNEPYNVIDKFARRHPHQLKVIYCSCDSSEANFKENMKGKPWLAMEWDDGSNLEPPSPNPTSPFPPPSSTPREPFLLATDHDLESDLHTTDPSGSLYLRPFSRVHLAEKFQVLGVPGVVVYGLGKRKGGGGAAEEVDGVNGGGGGGANEKEQGKEDGGDGGGGMGLGTPFLVEEGEILEKHVRIESLRDQKGDERWDKWEKGEKTGGFGFGDAIVKLRWTLGLSAVAAAYFVAVRVGGVEDVVGKITEQVTRSYFTGGR
ncbi:hypothetical protein T439DRAFT_376580 [Meredithblackwellia eburnea MCA 4105]